MKISEVEKRTGITSHNIRFYEKEGLLHPHRNRSNGYREYTEADIEQINRIKLLRMLDISIIDIKTCLEGKENLSAILNQHLKDLQGKENKIKQNLLICQALVDMQVDDLSETMIAHIIYDKEAYLNNLEEIRKQDKIEAIFFVSKQLCGCIIGFSIVIITIVQFYINIYSTYMNRAFQIITILFAINIVVCICRIIYANEKSR